MRVIGAVLKSWEFWLILLALIGVVLTTLYFWVNPFLRQRDLRVLEPIDFQTPQAFYERKMAGNKPVTLDAATLRLKAQLLDAQFKPLNPKAGGDAIILMYHDAVPKRDERAVWFDTTPPEFEAEIAWLKGQGANFVSLDQIRHHLTRNTPLPKNAVALTFDDNYVGFYKHIYPILKREKLPAMMFVHTDYVGAGGDRPKMDWQTLRQLDREGLVTIGSHTLSHPEDLSKLSPEQQRRELLLSKQILERQLGRPVPYISYPNGKADAMTWKIAREVGYAMGFMEDWQTAAEAPDMLAVSRYIQLQVKRAWFDLNPEQLIVEQRRKGLVERGLRNDPIRVEYLRRAGVSLALIKGGRAESRLSPYRESVSDFVAQSGAMAGINGTFFADADLRSRDNMMVGPIVAGPSRWFIPERNPYIMYKIVERPLVAWNDKRIVFVPVKLDMNRPETIKTFMPSFTDVFVGGAWIVHGGKVVWPLKNPPADHGDWRPRVFFGYSKGDVVLGASLNPVSTVGLARAAALAGVEEAVLLDSGYSTSLVFQKKLLAVGRKWDGVPSRPVPHAIVLHGRVGREVAQQ